MRTRLSIAFGIGIGLASLVACGSGGETEPSQPGSGPAPGATSSQDAGASGPSSEGGASADAGATPPDGSSPPARATVIGSVFDSWTNDPLPSFGVRLIGADGVVQDLTTDSTGKFTAASVKLPYDMGIIPEGAPAPKLAYLGVTNLAPNIRWTVDRPYARSGDVKVTVNAPDCGANECRVEISVRTPDGYATGSTGGTTRGAPRFESTMALRFDGAPTRSANVRAMVRDEAGTYYAFAETTISVTEGSTTIVPAIAPQPVPLAGTFSIEVESIGIPASWGAPHASAYVALPGGATASLPGADSAFVSFGLPQLVGGSVRASGVVASSTGALSFATTETRLSFQRLATIGLDLTPAADWRIRLGASRPFASVDQMLTPSGSALSSDLFMSFSQNRHTFTLTP